MALRQKPIDVLDSPVQLGYAFSTTWTKKTCSQRTGGAVTMGARAAASRMTGMELLEAAIKCQKVDRIPTSPMVHFFAAHYAGITVAEFIGSASASFAAIKKVFVDAGGWDIMVAPCGYAPTMYALEVPIKLKLPGRELPPDEVWQADEQEVMAVGDFDLVLQDGWNKYFYRDLLPRFRPSYGNGIPGLIRFGFELTRISIDLIRPVRYFSSRGIPIMTASPATPPFELLSAARSFNAFFLDLYDRPEKVIATMDAMLPTIIKNGIQLAKLTRIPRVSVGGSRGSGQFLSLPFFERFYFPWLKQIVEALHEEGITAILHFDSNWDHNLEYLRELPRHSCVLQLDGTTNMRKAKKLLAGHMCLMGDVPARLLAFGTPDEVSAYCRQVVEAVGPEGLILGSGCEVPFNARFENLRALLDTARAYRM